MSGINLECPRCGADMNVDFENLEARCPYCDHHEMLKIDVNRAVADKEETKRVEKRLKESARREEKRLKEQTRQRELDLQYADKRHKRESFAPNFKAILMGIVLLIAVGVGIFIYISFSNSEKKHAENDLKIPISASSIENGNYDKDNILDAFQKSGFTNVHFEKIEDVVVGLLTKDGELEKVTVNGKTSFSEGEWVSKDAEVLIYYHAKKSNPIISSLKSKLKNMVKIKDPNDNVFQVLSDGYYCPNCDADLEAQEVDGKVFDPEDEVWICTECGEVVYDTTIASTMEEFPGVVWVCDNCEEILSKQQGFHDTCGTWVCIECGYKNEISEDKIE